MQHLYFKYLQNNICDSLGVPYCAVCVLCKGLSYPSVHLDLFGSERTVPVTLKGNLVCFLCYVPILTCG